MHFACFGALVPMESGGGEGGDGNGGGDADDAAGVEGGGISGVDGVNGGGDADDAAGVEGGGISGVDGVNGAAGEDGSCTGCVKKKEPTYELNACFKRFHGECCSGSASLSSRSSTKNVPSRFADRAVAASNSPAESSSPCEGVASMGLLDAWSIDSPSESVAIPWVLDSGIDSPCESVAS